MKRLLAILAALALLCSPVLTMPVHALEASTITEMSAQKKEIAEFPDPEARYATVTENNLVFNVYDEFAVLAECKDTTITEITIPDTIKDVPVVGLVNSPFGFCRQLKKITLPDTFSHFDWTYLVNTTLVRLGSKEEPVPSVAEVCVSETNPNFTVSDGLLYSKDMKTLIGCPPASGIKEVKISEKTETIGDWAFAENMTLETAVIPAHVKHLCNSAFAVCPKLTSVELPESITAICGDMFYGCTALTEVKLNGKLEKIGYGAFYQCSALRDFTIPETVYSIGSAAFEGAACVENVSGVQYVQKWVVGSDEDIASADLRNDTVGIAEWAFYSRKSMTSLNIPASVKNIGDICFFSLSIGEPAVLRHHAGFIHERNFAAAHTLTDIYIYDPECDIFDSEKTIPATYKFRVKIELPVITLGETLNEVQDQMQEGDIVIHGYAGSTAQAYAEKYNRVFKVISEEPTAGDLNDDGALDASDLKVLQKLLLGKTADLSADWTAADLNGDGFLNAADLSLLKRKLLAQN